MLPHFHYKRFAFSFSLALLGCVYRRVVRVSLWPACAAVSAMLYPATDWDWEHQKCRSLCGVMESEYWLQI